uniref:Uncharacterized protein n=1 Tax=Panagrolaimus sp. PS1159 TaxID=55785 RepID=A0AC35EY83_9BILA
MPPFFYTLNGYYEPKKENIYHNFEKFNLPEEVVGEDDKTIIDPIIPFLPGIKQILYFADATKSPYIPIPTPPNPALRQNSIPAFLPSDFWLPENDFQKVT